MSYSLACFESPNQIKSPFTCRPLKKLPIQTRTQNGSYKTILQIAQAISKSIRIDRSLGEQKQIQMYLLLEPGHNLCTIHTSDNARTRARTLLRLSCRGQLRVSPAK